MFSCCRSASIPLIVLGLACITAWAEDKPGQAPTAAEVDRLIASLGSPTFAERDAAAKKLSAIGPPAMDALRKTVKENKDLEIRRRCELLIAAIENRLDQLFVDYKAYGLPWPPESAPLVRYEYEVGSVNGTKPANPCGLAFLVRPKTTRDPPLLWEGLRTYEWRHVINMTVLDPRKATKGEIGSWLRGVPLYHDDAIPLAVQCKARDWDTFAQVLLDALVQRQLQERKTHPERSFPSFKTSLVERAWSHWEIELSTGDWPPIAKRFKSLQAAEKTLDTEANRWLMKSLDAALVPTQAKPGSIEAMIDDLRDAGSTDVTYQWETDAKYLKVLEHGFDAVPGLIKHLDDERLTRCKTLGFNNFAGYRYRICHVVTELLQGIAGEDLGTDWVRRQQGYTATKAWVEAWWARAQKTGEEAYGLAHVLPSGPEVEWPSDHWLRIIAKKYPRDLSKVYRNLLENRTEIQSWPVCAAIRQSCLTNGEKAELFLLGARQINPDHRRAALAHLMDKDFPHIRCQLLQNLEAAPATPEGLYSRCREVGLISMVLATDDAHLWEALAKLTTRADLGFRMEILQQLGCRDGERKQRQRRLEILSAYLDDRRVREISSNPKKFSGPCAGFTFPRLEVRDMAAMSIARLLHYLADDPQPEWTAKQWAEFHATVRKALQGELSSKKPPTGRR